MVWRDSSTCINHGRLHWCYQTLPSGRPARVRGCGLRMRSTGGLRGPPEAASGPRRYRPATAPRTLVSGIAVKGNPYQNSGRGRGCDSVTIAAGATADVGRRTTPQLSLAGSSGDLAISVREPNGNQECVQRGTSAAW